VATGWLLRPHAHARVAILDPPAEDDEYGPGSYAVFFADPDGMKLEYLFTPAWPLSGMSRSFKMASAALFSLLVVFGGVTGAALESSGVAVLETRDAQGATRRTRVWFAEHESALWLEAATPERAWLRDVRRSPRVILRGAGDVEHFEALPLPDEISHEKIRRLLRAKYGWRDWWIGLLQDTSRSVAVRLVP
jgi:F420H(2)-dependent quinone reductase